MIQHKIALGITYDGAAYHGWQYQNNELPTVQYALERALSRVANHDVKVVCAGRTDAGVHATAQVVHFMTEAERTDYSWVFGTNSNLPRDISASWAKPVPHEFEARYSARSRRYRYIIYNHPIRPALLGRELGWARHPLDIQMMQAGAKHLLGEHDFSSFRGANCQSKTAMRQIFELDISRHHDLVIVDVRANAFLLHMVRNIVGVLVDVGSGQYPPEWVKSVLAARDRKAAGVTFMPYGLYLVAVEYPQHFDLPKVPLGPYFLG